MRRVPAALWAAPDKMGRFGKALGAVGAVAVGAPLVAGAIRKIPGWDKTMKNIGGKVFDVTHGGQNLRTPQDVRVYLDGREIARNQEGHLARRRKQRAHQRKSRR